MADHFADRYWGTRYWTARYFQGGAVDPNAMQASLSGAGAVAATLGPVSTVEAPSTNFGWGLADVQRIGDTRWQGVREAREAARDAFREVRQAKPAKRKAAAWKAAEAVAAVAREVAKPPVAETGGSRLDASAFYDVLQDLDALQGILAAMADAERIRAEQARAAAAQWARIEAELVENAREDELLIVLALAF